jgi:hypothetical protein
MPVNPLSAFGGQAAQQGQQAQKKQGPDPLSAFGNQPQPDQEQQAPSAAPTPQLPEGAKGFDPSGQPYFGDGIPGILKKWKYNFSKDVKDVNEDDWTAIKDRWKTMQGQTVEQMGGGARLSLLGETIGKGYQDIVSSSQGSVLAPILKGIGATVPALGELFSIPAQKVEQALGAKEGFQEAANQVESPLPRLDENHFTQALEELPGVGLAYDFARIALSPSDNKWDYAKQKIEEGWQSGRILYSQVFDATLKEKFLAEYREGQDPALLAMKLQNPLAEMAGQIILDPLNLVGAFGKASKVAKELDAAHDSVVASGLLKTEAGKDAFKLMSEAADEAGSIKALDALAVAQADAVKAVQGESRLLNVGYGINDLTTSSRQNAIVTKGKELLGNMALILKQSGMSYDGVAEAVLYGIKSVSGNADEMKAGLAGLSHLPNANMWLADDYIETFTMMNRMMTDETGLVTGARLKNLMKVSNPAEFAEQATKLMAGAAKSQLPDVSELEAASKLVKEAASGAGEVTEKTRQMAEAFDNLPNHVKIINRIDQTLSKYIKNPINSFLSPFYFNLQGGVAVKNILSNNELILLDQGPKAWLKDGKYWSQESKINYLKDIFGELPESAHGFKSLVSSMTEKKPFLFGKVMESGEEGGAVTTVASSVRGTFKTMIPKAMPSLAKEVEAGVLTRRQADKLTSLMLKNNGNVERAINEFRDLYKVGAVEDWRNLDFVSDFERDSLQSLDYWNEIEDLAQRGATTTAEVEEVFARINKSIDSRSELAARDVIGLSPDHPSAPAWGDLMKAVEDGHLNPNDQQVFTAIMESAEQARLEYQTLLDNVALKAQQALSQEGKLAEAQHIGEEMNRVREVLRKSAPATAKETHGITQDAWRWSDAIKAEKKPTPETLKAFWTKAGLTGEPPLDLDKGTLLKKLWEERFGKVTDAWNGSFDAIVGESETILKQMDGIIDTTELQSMATRTRHMTAQAQALRSATFDGKALRIRPAQDVAYVAKQYGVKPVEILNTINNALPEGAKAFEKIEDVPTEQVMNVLEQVRNEKGLPEAAGIKVPPPHPLGTQPSPARAWNENSRGAKYLLDQIKTEILGRWGQTDDARKVSPAMESVLAKVAQEAGPKMAEIKATALKVARENRNFTLLNYGEKTYGDIAKSYVMPYHFFYTRSYKNWVKRIATNPEILAGYAKYKNALEDIHKDLPDWYKQQLNINPLSNETVAGMLGIEQQHPLFINLEAAINPLYGLTGTDFNDPAKRTNWATASMDDLGKFGPSVWSPIQMGIAAILYQQGETDAASRWGSRLIPETAQVKAITSMFGRPIELDPAVQFFSGGIDPYERGRMGYAAASLINSGQYTPEQIQEEFQQQKGETWDLSYQMAVQSRAGSSISSYFLGVGFKPRGENDVMVETMYTELNKLYAMSDTMSGDQYKNAWEQMRAKYPEGLVDTVLLAKKGGDKRDAAYSYNVLGRLPPGEMSAVFKAIGIDQQDISKFYDSKGFTATADKNGKPITWTATEKSRFMNAIVDLGAMLKIPEDSTREEWGEVRNMYAEVYSGVQEQLGKDIWDKVSHYYDLKDDNREAADAFKQQHPEVVQALQMKGAAVANTPLLSAYYGGIDSIEAYISGKVRQELSDKYGAEIYDIQTGYFDAPNQRAYLSEHPELKKFWDDKRVLDKESEKMFIQMGSNLPTGKSAQFREGFAPQSGVQETLYNALQPQEQVPSWQEVSQGMAPWLQDEVTKYWQNGKKISTRAQKQLDFLASQGGYYDYKDLLRTAGLAMQSQGQRNQPNALSAFGQQ